MTKREAKEIFQVLGYKNPKWKMVAQLMSLASLIDGNQLVGQICSIVTNKGRVIDKASIT